eukprot:jgi/Ulvmu1/1729/UM117_0006.1
MHSSRQRCSCMLSPRRLVALLACVGAHLKVVPAVHTRELTASQDVDCQQGRCREGAQAFLAMQDDDFRSDVAISTSCSSPMTVHYGLIRHCAADLLADRHQGCSCTPTCAQFMQTVPAACMASAVSYMCNTAQEAYKRGVDIVGVLEMLIEGCYYKQFSHSLPSPLCSRVPPKNLTTVSNCSSLTKAPVRQPSETSNPEDIFRPPPSLPNEDAVVDQSIGAGLYNSSKPAPVPVCGNAACGAGLQEWLQQNFKIFFVVTECGDLSMLHTLLTETCAADLGRRGPGCRCSSRCLAAVQALSAPCVTQVRDVLCMHAEAARRAGVEVAAAASGVLSRCYVAGNAHALGMDPSCTSVPPFDREAVCGLTQV